MSQEIPSGYKLLARLSEDGEGSVWKVWDHLQKRIMALKIMALEVGGSTRATAREVLGVQAFQLPSSAPHANILQVHQVWVWEQRICFLMDFAEGGLLDAKLDRSPWPLERAATFVEMLSLAAHSIHQKGFVHCDISPDNIWLTNDGEPKLAGFASAQRIDTPNTGTIAGTPWCMSPEQVTGKAITPATDVYSLRAILYRLLTGRPPFKEETLIKTLHQVVEGAPIPPGRLRPNLPSDLDAICLTFLKKEPQDRYETAEALADDLKRFRLGEAIRGARRSR